MFQPRSSADRSSSASTWRRIRSSQTILFPQDVALPTSYLNDVRFDLRRGNAGMAFITDSSRNGPNGIIVVDLDSAARAGAACMTIPRPSRTLQTFLPLVEGRPFLQRHPDGTADRTGVGSDGIAISADGEAPLTTARWEVAACTACATTCLSIDLADEAAVVASVVDEGDRGGASDGLESDAEGPSTRRTTSTTPFSVAAPTASGSGSPTILGCSGRTRCRWRPTAISTSPPISSTANRAITRARTCARSPTPCSASTSARCRCCCGNVPGSRFSALLCRGCAWSSHSLALPCWRCPG